MMASQSYIWLDVPKNIVGIKYDIFDEVSQRYSKIEHIISNIDKVVIEYKLILKNIKDDKQKNDNVNKNDIISKKDDEQKDDDDDESKIEDKKGEVIEKKIERLVPPYVVPCSFSKIDGCPKKANVNIDGKYLCWLHTFTQN